MNYAAGSYAVAVIGVSALLACVGWIAASDVLALHKEEHSVTVTITPEDSYDDVVDMLKDNGLIEYKSLFKLFSAITGGKGSLTGVMLGTLLIVVLLVTTRPIAGGHYMYPIYPFNWHALRALLVRRPIAPDNT